MGATKEVLITSDSAGNPTEIVLASNALDVGGTKTTGYAPVVQGDGSVEWAEVMTGAGLTYKGTWDASTNTPALSDSGGGGVQGDYYIVSVSGSTSVDGITDWVVGDWIIHNGSNWQKLDNTDQVDSVFGRTGAVVATTSDYDASQVDNDSTVTGAQVSDALNNLKTDVDANTAHSTSTGTSHLFIDQDVRTTASPTFVNVNPTGTVDGRDVATDGLKLDGIEAGAEVNNISDVNATDLTDGGETTLHTHAASAPAAHATSHTDGSDDIQDATSLQKGLATAAQITKLDGIEAGAEVNNISDVNATDLTDAGDSTLHYHASDRDRANHTGTQTASTISDFDTEVSNNTDVAANTAHSTSTGTSHLFIDQDVRTTASPTFVDPLIDKLSFDTTAGETAAEGELAWNAAAGTLDLGRPDGGATQLGQEMVLSERPTNATGAQINNGEAVYISGATGGIPDVLLANAGNLDARSTIAIATHDVAIGARGAYTTRGVVRDFDTSSWSVNDTLYLDTTDGQLTNTPPAAPNWVIEIGKVLVSNATTGSIDVNIKSGRGEDLASFFSGTFREGFDALVTSNGTVITMSLEQDGGGDLTMQFSTGEVTLDCTPAQTIALTAGTDASPQENFVYIPISTKVVTLSTTGWPAEEHIKISYFLVQTAASVQTYGALVNQNWNDALYHAGGGHLVHITERVRRSGAEYFSGLAGEGTDDYSTSGASSVTLQIGAGVIYQMHTQSLAAKNTSTGDEIYVVNHDTTAYTRVTNLYDVVNDASGGTLSNNYFNIVVAVVGNKGGEYSPILVNLPTGTYNSLADAEADVSGYDVFDLPREFTKESSTGVLVCRLTFRKTGGTWAYQSTVDLRGLTPTTASGGGAGGTATEFSDSLFRVHDNTDATKELAYEVSGVTSATTRTITVADQDIDMTPNTGSYQAPPSEGAFADGDKTKLDGIEALADVTDATNVDAAGAVMNSDTSTAAMSFVIDDDTMATASATTVPTSESTKAYVDSLVQGAIVLQGDWNASTNTPDITGTTTTGYAWRVSVAGSTNLGGITDWAVGDLAVKTAASWLKIDNEDVAAVWGNISGTLSNQTDLQSALDAKNDAPAEGAFVDGDKTKLDGIESGATADQTGAEIKSLYEAELDTNAFTDAEKTKLSGIEALADVTDATNVEAAGAVMDGDLIVTSAGAADSGKPIKLDADGNVDATMINDADINLDNVTEGTTNKFFTATEETKLAGIEAGAEVNNISDVNATDLTDGGETTLHTHAAAAPAAHASTHTNGTDDIQDATASQKGLATATQITKLDGIETGATAGGLTWNTITTNTTATAENGYMCDTSSSAITLTLPATPTAGQSVGVYYSDSANTLTIARNGSNIRGTAADLNWDTQYAGALLVYQDATQGWVIVSEIAGNITQDVGMLLSMPGSYMSGRAATEDLVEKVGKVLLVWDLADADLHSFKAEHIADDTGASNPTINMEIAGTEALSSDVTCSETEATGTIGASKTVTAGDRVEITVVTTGTNGDASDLTVRLVWRYN